MTEVGLAQVDGPQLPPVILLGEGVKRGGGERGTLRFPYSGLLFLSFFVPKAPARVGREEGSG